MSAPRKFDEIDVIERALLCFWRLGYEGCSISELVSATGLQRQSLYNAFGNKEGLFERALALYHERVEASLAPLRAEDAGLAQLQSYFRDFLALQRQLGVGACLVVQTAFSPAMTSPAIRRQVHASADSVRRTFARFLQRVAARADGDSQRDCHDRAADLYALLNGLSALAATGVDQRVIDRGIEREMARLDADLCAGRLGSAARRGR